MNREEGVGFGYSDVVDRGGFSQTGVVEVYAMRHLHNEGRCLSRGRGGRGTRRRNDSCGESDDPDCKGDDGDELNEEHDVG